MYFDDGSFSTAQNPIHHYTSPGLYNVKLSIENENHCLDTIIHAIKIKPDFLLVMPNSFTPNGDGLNEVFKPGAIIGADEKSYGLFVYNRWGELLYEGHNLTVGWDSYVKGKQVQEGVYTWRVKIKDLEGALHQYAGQVTVLK